MVLRNPVNHRVRNIRAGRETSLQEHAGISLALARKALELDAIHELRLPIVKAVTYSAAAPMVSRTRHTTAFIAWS